MADEKILGERGKALEDEFFRKEDERLTAKLRELKAKEATREELSRISGIKNTAILDRLIQLGIHAETLVALSIVPLAEVAWADGAIDAKEEQAVLDRAAKSGVTPGSSSYDLLKSWLERRPEPRLLTAWIHMIQGISENLTAEQVEALARSSAPTSPELSALWRRRRHVRAHMCRRPRRHSLRLVAHAIPESSRSRRPMLPRSRCRMST